MSNEATRKVEEKNGKGDVPTCLFLQKVGSWPKQLFFFHVFFRILKASFFTISTIHFHRCRDLQRSNVSASKPFFEVQSLRWEPGKKTNSWLFLWNLTDPWIFWWEVSCLNKMLMAGWKKKTETTSRWDNFLMSTMRHQVHQYMSPLFHGEEEPDLWCKGAWNIYSLIGAKASSMQVVSSDSI